MPKYPAYLDKRYNRYYAVLDIPRALRPKFAGKPRFVKSLKTDSLSQAERWKLPFIAKWKAQIEEARLVETSHTLAPDKLALSWQPDYLNAPDKETQDILSEIIDDKVQELAGTDEDVASRFHLIAKGLSIPTDAKIEEWLASRNDIQKSNDMARADVKQFAFRFPYTHLVTRTMVLRWIHDLQNDEELKPSTIQRKISPCRGYWHYLKGAGAVRDDVDPFYQVIPKKKSKTKAYIESQRVHFTANQVVSLLLAAEEKRDRELARLIWLGMWTGCRIEELCSLRTEKVASDRFSVEDAKTVAGFREVPIHSRLVDLISSLVDSSRDGYVLPNLTFNKYNDRSNAIGKRFGRLKAKLGFGEQHVFHSIRKTVATEFRSAEVPESTAADILGHDIDTMTYGLYSGSVHFPVKKAAMERLDYPVGGTSSFLLS